MRYHHSPSLRPADVGGLTQSPPHRERPGASVSCSKPTTPPEQVMGHSSMGPSLALTRLSPGTTETLKRLPRQEWPGPLTETGCAGAFRGRYADSSTPRMGRSSDGLLAQPVATRSACLRPKAELVGLQRRTL
jgi:hypothetical protein